MLSNSLKLQILPLFFLSNFGSKIGKQQSTAQNPQQQPEVQVTQVAETSPKKNNPAWTVSSRTNPMQPIPWRNTGCCSGKVYGFPKKWLVIYSWRCRPMQVMHLCEKSTSWQKINLKNSRGTEFSMPLNDYHLLLKCQSGLRILIPTKLVLTVHKVGNFGRFQVICPDRFWFGSKKKNPCQPIPHFQPRLNRKNGFQLPNCEALKITTSRVFWMFGTVNPLNPQPYQWVQKTRPAWQHPARIQASLSLSGSRACNLQISHLRCRWSLEFCKDVTKIQRLFLNFLSLSAQNIWRKRKTQKTKRELYM